MQRVALMGCGNNDTLKIKTQLLEERGSYEIVRLDIDEACKPDILWDLNDRPLPFATEEFDEIHFYEVLEHIGGQGDWQGFFEEFAEYWRILKPGGRLCASVPMWNSIWAWGDPGHLRVISRGTLSFLDRSIYERDIGKTTMTDYRSVWEHSFSVAHMQETENTFYFVLQKV